MMLYPQALDLVLGASPLPVAERCTSAHILGRVLAAPVFSPQSLPSFNNAALDGYALPAGDFPAGSEFVVEGRQAAGEALTTANSNTVWEVTTGACIPRGLSTVAPIEQVEVLAQDAVGEPTRIRLRALATHSQHVRLVGEDVASGEHVLDAGKWVHSQQLMLLSALGIGSALVARRPKVAVISTGRELSDDLSEPLCGGQVRNANGAYLAARATQAGAQLVRTQTVTDEASAWRNATEQALAAGADVIVSTGAVSKGRHDFIPVALAEQGAQILFQTVAIRPGKPLLFARLPNGALYFGLPGNPGACAVGWRFFVEPALRVMLGLPVESPCRLPLATAPGCHRSGFHQFLKGRIALNTDGRCVVSALQGQESFRILQLARANAWLVLQQGEQVRQPGDTVAVYSLGHEQPLFGAGV